MFENQSSQPNPNQAPANLPFGQSGQVSPPMGNATVASTTNQFNPPASQPAPASAPPAKPIEDIFAPTDAAKPAPRSYPQQNFPAGAPIFTPMANQGPVMTEADLFGGRKLSLGKIITVVIIVLVLIGIVALGFWVYGYVASVQSQQANQPEVTNPTPAVTQPQPTANLETPATPTATPEVLPPPTSTPITDENRDSDGDGLTDTEEKNLGTNPNLADTDTDGLTDWAEVRVYHTDPLNPDTDGDGFKDGEEVINGYDPTRAGNFRLYEVPKATTTQ